MKKHYPTTSSMLLHTTDKAADIFGIPKSDFQTGRSEHPAGERAELFDSLQSGSVKLHLSTTEKPRQFSTPLENTVAKLKRAKMMHQIKIFDHFRADTENRRFTLYPNMTKLKRK